MLQGLQNGACDNIDTLQLEYFKNLENTMCHYY